MSLSLHYFLADVENDNEAEDLDQDELGIIQRYFVKFLTDSFFVTFIFILLAILDLFVS